jgi:glyoxylase-like metal-dependent hydrolase (beta-lactamase superfamily II)
VQTVDFAAGRSFSDAQVDAMPNMLDFSSCPLPHPPHLGSGSQTATYYNGQSMTESVNGPRCQSDCPNARRISVSEDWFEVYEVASNLFAFCEPRHYENTTVSLIIGPEKAALIDTGCGIGNLRKAVEEVTDKTVVVINTHTHLDHLGSNRQFDEIAMFDHQLSRRTAMEGASHQNLQREILAENLVTKPWPRDFDPTDFTLPPFNVDHWLRDGDRLDLGGQDLEVIYTPGEAADHICLLDRADRILFCGDILLHGPVWTHLAGGSLKDLVTSYRRLMGHFEEFDHLMPGHNQPWLDKGLLPETLAGAEKVLSGQVEPEDIIDPWNRRLKQYSFGRFAITTRQ